MGIKNPLFCYIHEHCYREEFFSVNNILICLMCGWYLRFNAFKGQSLSRKLDCSQHLIYIYRWKWQMSSYPWRFGVQTITWEQFSYWSHDKTPHFLSHIRSSVALNSWEGIHTSLPPYIWETRTPSCYARIL